MCKVYLHDKRILHDKLCFACAIRIEGSDSKLIAQRFLIVQSLSCCKYRDTSEVLYIVPMSYWIFCTRGAVYTAYHTQLNLFEFYCGVRRSGTFGSRYSRYASLHDKPAQRFILSCFFSSSIEKGFPRVRQSFLTRPLEYPPHCPTLPDVLCGLSMCSRRAP